MRSRITRHGAFRHALLLLGFGAAFGVARGQTPASFEYVYGNHCGDGGQKGVTPVVNCTGVVDGYIAVGSTQNDECDPNDVYVVRTKADGTLYWATAYDINGAGGGDVGESIVECSDGSGFVVTGITNTAPGPGLVDAFVMKIDCDGKELWTTTFSADGYVDALYDVKEAPPQSGGTASDIVVAGFRHVVGQPLVHDGWLIRLTAAGVPIWQKTYDLGAEERFFGVMVTKVGPDAGDIVAVGHWNDGSIPPGAGLQGLIMRVDGNGTMGGIGMSSRGVALFGNTGTEMLNSVIELQNGAQAGNLVAIGVTNNFTSNDVYVVKTGPDPCDHLASIALGNASDQYGSINDYGADIFEATAAMPLYGGGGVGGGTAVGDLLITGRSDESLFFPSIGSPFHHHNILLHALRPGNLMGVANTGRLFGSDPNEGDIEWGSSLSQVTGKEVVGVVLCGSTHSNLRHDNDGIDLYLIKTDNIGNTGCEDTWFPERQVMNYSSCEEVEIDDVDLDAEADVVETEVETAIDVCPRPFPKVNRNGGDELSDISDAIRTYPNPILRGGMLTLTYAADLPAEVGVVIVDELGEAVMRWSTAVVAGENRIEVTTEDLPAGTYTVTIDDGVEPRHARIVVVGGR